jgi:hypothetical protein
MLEFNTVRTMRRRFLCLAVLAALGGCAADPGGGYPGGVPYAVQPPYDDGIDGGGLFLGYGGSAHDGGYYRGRRFIHDSDHDHDVHRGFAGRPGGDWSGHAAHAGIGGHGAGGHAGGGAGAR